MSKVNDYKEEKIKNVKNYRKDKGALTGAGVAFAGAIGGIVLTIATGGLAGPVVAAGAMVGGPTAGTITGGLIDKSKHHRTTYKFKI